MICIIQFLKKLNWFCFDRKPKRQRITARTTIYHSWILLYLEIFSHIFSAWHFQSSALLRITIWKYLCDFFAVVLNDFKLTLVVFLSFVTFSEWFWISKQCKRRKVRFYFIFLDDPNPIYCHATFVFTWFESGFMFISCMHYTWFSSSPPPFIVTL